MYIDGWILLTICPAGIHHRSVAKQTTYPAVDCGESLVVYKLGNAEYTAPADHFTISYSGTARVNSAQHVCAYRRKMNIRSRLTSSCKEIPQYLSSDRKRTYTAVRSYGVIDNGRTLLHNNVELSMYN